jgi:hypothetical protein
MIFLFFYGRIHTDAPGYPIRPIGPIRPIRFFFILHSAFFILVFHPRQFAMEGWTLAVQPLKSTNIFKVFLILILFLFLTPTKRGQLSGSICVHPWLDKNLRALGVLGG